MTAKRPVDLQGCQGDKKVNIFIDRGDKFLLYERKFHPPTQESTALAVEECMSAAASIAAMDLPCFGGFRRGASFLGRNACSLSLTQKTLKMAR